MLRHFTIWGLPSRNENQRCHCVHGKATEIKPDYVKAKESLADKNDHSEKLVHV